MVEVVVVTGASAGMGRAIADAFAKRGASVTEVTYLGAVWGTMAALRRMRTRDRASAAAVALALRG